MQDAHFSANRNWPVLSSGGKPFCTLKSPSNASSSPSAAGLRSFSSYSPAFHYCLTLPFLPLPSPRSLTGTSHLEIPQGTQMSWGLLRPTPRGGACFQLAPSRGIPFQPPGPAGPRKGQPLPFWWPQATTAATQPATALDTDQHSDLGAQNKAPSRRRAHVHRWPCARRDTTWRRLGWAERVW